MFVFNGLLSGVSLPGRREGEIGAQRIAALLGAFLRRQSGPDAVTRLLGLLEQRARRVDALDLAIACPDQIVALSRFESHAEYYRLHHLQDDGLAIVCSQPLDGRGWTPLPTGRPVVLPLATAR